MLFNPLNPPLGGLGGMVELDFITKNKNFKITYCSPPKSPLRGTWRVRFVLCFFPNTGNAAHHSLFYPLNPPLGGLWRKLI
ncbi:MAG: hypothetical protein C0433_17775 [Cyclobacterium sp.]|nr:hypothetical protein [Cyclobacterium sp.]